jgi:hypothetical protein
MVISLIIRAKGRTQGKMEKAKITEKGLRALASYVINVNRGMEAWKPASEGK